MTGDALTEAINNSKPTHLFYRYEAVFMADTISIEQHVINVVEQPAPTQPAQVLIPLTIPVFTE